MQFFSVSPLEMFKCLARHKELILVLIKREVSSKYKGSVLGWFWTFFNPLLMLTVYTLVFSVIFKTRWNGAGDSKIEFALILFAGLMVFTVFSDSITKAPGLIVNNVNFVKKVVFPVEILPWINIGVALFHFCISLCIWLITYMIFMATPKITVLLLPIALAPFVLLTVGVSWFLAALGVFLRDIAQVVGVAVTTLMFLSPIFYPTSALPAEYQWLIQVNPLTNSIELARALMLFGNFPNFVTWLWQLCVSALIAYAGFFWFQKTRKGFADVL
jgi:lipopolysaccharide transport system permease protein